MDILKQCQKWHENNEHHKIIEALEGIEERTPEMDSQLARGCPFCFLQGRRIERGAENTCRGSCRKAAEKVIEKIVMRRWRTTQFNERA